MVFFPSLRFPLKGNKHSNRKNGRAAIFGIRWWVLHCKSCCLTLFGGFSHKDPNMLKKNQRIQLNIMFMHSLGIFVIANGEFPLLDGYLRQVILNQFNWQFLGDAFLGWFFGCSKKKTPPWNELVRQKHTNATRSTQGRRSRQRKGIFHPWNSYWWRNMKKPSSECIVKVTHADPWWNILNGRSNVRGKPYGTGWFYEHFTTRRISLCYRLAYHFGTGKPLEKKEPL